MMEILILLYLMSYIGSSQASFQSAGCSDEGCGIPCYLRPASDDCHYADKTSPCTEDGSDLAEKLYQLNNTLARLREKLIQKGIIPAGNNCPPLPSIEHGGVIYTDLLISPGVKAYYVCMESYSLHGKGEYECAVDGQWIGSDQTPTCEDSFIECEALVAIQNGHVSYSMMDTLIIKPGEVVTYSCDQPYTLKGSRYRVCIKNGTWTETEPTCIKSSDSKQVTTEDNSVPVAVGTTFGATIGLLVILLIVIGIFCVIKKRKTLKPALFKTVAKGYESLDKADASGHSNKDTNVEEPKRSLINPETVRSSSS